jgi:hypothetical protein
MVEGGRLSAPRRRIQDVILERSPLASTTRLDLIACQTALACIDRKYGLRASTGCHNSPPEREGLACVLAGQVGNEELDDGEKQRPSLRGPWTTTSGRDLLPCPVCKNLRCPSIGLISDYFGAWPNEGVRARRLSHQNNSREGGWVAI